MEYLHNQSSNTSKVPNVTVISSAQDLPINQILHIIYGILGFIAIIGNCLVFAIIVTYRRGKMLRSSTSLLIASMAIMDMMTGIIVFITPTFVIPAKDYPFPKNIINLDLFCRIIDSEYLLFYFGFGSVLTVTAIAIERWLAIARPFHYKKIVTTKRIKYFIGILWFLCLFIPVDIILQTEYDGNSSGRCRWNQFAKHQPGVTIFLLLEILRLFLPILITLICYADIARRVLYPNKIYTLTQATSRKTSIRHRTKRKVTIMAATAALVFILCWLPNEIYFTLSALNRAAYDITTIRMTKTLIILSSSLSPLIYSATNEEYRKGLRSLLALIRFIITNGCTYYDPYALQPSRSDSSVKSSSMKS